MQEYISYLLRILRKFYNRYIWSTLPAKSDHGYWGGIPISGTTQRALDGRLPWSTPGHRPRFKERAAEQLEGTVRKGDTVICIGGGHGMTATKVAKLVGGEGSVIVFEPDAERNRRCTETLSMNDVNDRVEVHDNIVGSAYMTPSSNLGASIPVNNLPECDVLEMDCDGAELDILSELTIRPRALIVETHQGWESVPYEDVNVVEEKIANLGYRTSIYEGPWCHNLIVGKLDEK